VFQTDELIKTQINKCSNAFVFYFKRLNCQMARWP